MITAILQSFRIRHYLKNGFILLPSIFAAKLYSLELLTQLFITVASFSLVTSAVYIFNDLVDLKRDQMHPIKKTRPLPSGKLSKKTAIILSVFLLCLGMVAGNCINLVFLKIALVYVGMNLIYSLWIKHVPVVDLLFVSIGFVLRIVLGGLICQVILSEWIIIMTFLLAFFLITSKRYSELTSLRIPLTKETRPLLKEYNREFLMVSMAISAAVVMIGYIMYTLQASASSYFYTTSIFVIYGIFRYLQVVLLSTESQDPTTILIKDHFLQIAIVGWLLSILWFMY